MLDNIRHERFARYIAKGETKTRAYRLAGYKPSKSNAKNLWSYKGSTSQKIQRRVKQLIEHAKDLTESDILDSVMATRDLAKQVNQLSAALKADEMLGKQLHGMFKDTKESLHINISNMSWQQIESYLHERYGERAIELTRWLKAHYAGGDTGQGVPATSGSLNGSKGDSGRDAEARSPTQHPKLTLVHDADTD